MKDAILSAIENVRNAGIGRDVLRVDYCNLVLQADIARKIGRSRQLVHQYMMGERGPGSFPRRSAESRTTCRFGTGCSRALAVGNNMVREEVLRDAEEVELINTVLELTRQKADKPEFSREVINSVSPQSAS